MPATIGIGWLRRERSRALALACSHGGCRVSALSRRGRVSRRPSVVTVHGCVELWHPRCWDARDEPIAVERRHPIAIIAPPRVSHAARGIALAAVAALTAVGSPRRGSRPLAVDALAPRASQPRRAEIVADPRARSRPTRTRRRARRDRDARSRTLSRPDRDGVRARRHVHLARRLDRTRHRQCRADARAAPRASSARTRGGIERAECGAGHCGVDLDGPRGRPIVAVAAGKVVRVERKELGSDGRSGRYVRLQHDDGTLTAYMHLDDVAEDLQVGDHVAPASTSARSARPPSTPPPRTATSASRSRHAGDARRHRRDRRTSIRRRSSCARRSLPAPIAATASSPRSNESRLTVSRAPIAAPENHIAELWAGCEIGQRCAIAG